jgi:hypothetical protein
MEFSDIIGNLFEGQVGQEGQMGQRGTIFCYKNF